MWGRDKDSCSLACLITTERFEELLRWVNEPKRKKFEEIIQSKDDKEGIIKMLLLRDKNIGEADLSVLAEYRLRGLEEIDLSYNYNIDSEGREIRFGRISKAFVWRQTA